MPDVLLKLRPEGDVEVSLGAFLGGAKFPVYRGACADAGAVAIKLASGSWVNRLPLSGVPVLLSALRAGGFSMAPDAALAGALQERATEARELLDAGEERLQRAKERLAGSGRALYRFQEGGVRWLAPRRGALLADTMGLGKTMQTLLALPDNASALVVCPAAVLLSWKREVEMWRPDLTPTLLRSSAAWRWPVPGEVALCTYGVMPDPEAELAPTPAGCVLVADEAHLLKSSKTARTKAWNNLRDRVKDARGAVWCLTGTPLVNRPPELWNVLGACLCQKEAFGGWPRFVQLFAGQKGRWGGYEWDSRGISDEVPDLLRRVMLHRKREEVLPDLPRKRRVTRLVNGIPASTIKACDAALEALARKGIDLSRVGPDTDLSKLIVGDAFELLSKARAQLASAKIPSALELVESYEEADEPLVVVSAHREPIDTIGKRPGWAAITGDTSPEDRGRICDEFQSGKLRGVAFTYRAGGVGITLTRAAHMLAVDLDWTPALCSQAEDRICRIGQTRGVLIERLVATHPLDERVCELLGIKQSIIDASVEASSVEAEHVHTDPAAGLATAAAIAAETVATAREEAAKAPPAEPVRRGPWHPEDFRVSTEPAVFGKFRGPSNPVEVHAAKAMLLLSALDPDHAGIHNTVGFSAFDGDLGHSLAGNLRDYGRLSDKQWSLAVKLAHKYRRQTGEPPI